MKTKIVVSLASILLLPACGGNGLMLKNNSEIPVISEPSAASVYVMGKLIGTTPMVVSIKSVYPVTYAQEDTKNYGRITLRHKSCADQVLTVSAQMISDGVKAKLDCPDYNEDVIKEKSLPDKSVKQRLQELQTLKNEGLINEDEYRVIRNRILKSF